MRRLTNPEEPTTPNIQAYANNIAEDSLDCGILALGWCRGAKCQKLATIKLFVTSLVITGIVQGIIEAYFRISAHQAALDHKYDLKIINWLLVTNGILEGVLAIVITYYAQKIHQAAWLGGLVIAQSLIVLISIIPSLALISEFSTQDTEITSNSNLCVRNGVPMNLLANQPDDIVTLILLFILQIGIACGNIGYITLGISYIDDNVESIDSPIWFGLILGGKIFGTLFGPIFSFGISKISMKNWWLGWIILGPILFVCGTILALFPRKLSRTIVKQAANRIEETVTNTLRLQPIKFLYDFYLMPSLKRLLTNKIFLLNTFAWVCVQTATINYILQEQKYVQSRFFLRSNDANGLTTELDFRFFSYLLRPPVIGILLICIGLLISKIALKARNLILWNIIIGVLAIIFYIIYVFIKCPEINIAGAYNGNIMRPLCSLGCECKSSDQFWPVCPENSLITYYSPCQAGCTEESFVNNVVIYQNCTCGPNSEYIPNIQATDGVCNFSDCFEKSIYYQILTIFGAALISTCLIGRIIITIRSVLEQDKSLSLAVAISFIQLILYIPGKLIYDYVSEETCQYWSRNYEKCYLHESPKHGDILNYISIGIILIAIILDIILYFFVNELECYPNESNENSNLIPLSTEQQSRIAPSTPLPQSIPNEPITEENLIQEEHSPLLDAIPERNNNSENQHVYAVINHKSNQNNNNNNNNNNNKILPSNFSTIDENSSENNSEMEIKEVYAEIDFTRKRRKNSYDDEDFLDFRLQTNDIIIENETDSDNDKNKKKLKNENTLETDF